MKTLLILFTIMTLANNGFAADEISDTAIAQKFLPSFVRVEYTLRFDNADSPEIGGTGERCPNCSQFHSLGDGSELVRQERPLEATGFLLSADQVLTSDAMIHPRFIKSISVRYQDELISATPAAYAVDHTAVILKLQKPFSKARPIEFTTSTAKPFKAVLYSEKNGQWTVNVSKMPDTFSMRQTGPGFLDAPIGNLIADAKGAALAICLNDSLPLDNTWQQSPLNWPMLSAAELESKLAALKEYVNGAILRVKLNFRSPKGSKRDFGYSGRSDSESVTEMNEAGLLIDPNHILILTKLMPKVTARLEHIQVYPETGTPAAAKFDETLSDYGALIATLEQPLQVRPVALSIEPITDFEQKMLLYAEVRIQGESRTVYFGHNRIASFSIGWHRQLEPILPLPVENRYLFDLDRQLIVLPLARREKIQNEENRWMDENRNLIAGCYLQPVLKALKENMDSDNIPLSEEDENRIAWLGIELQPLNEELARIQKVSNLTADGQTGAMVSFVYENSPASQSGLETGDILLRLHVENQPLPLEVSLGDDHETFEEMFLWDRLSELPEEYYDQIPTPWPNVENDFTRAMTNLGFGTRFQAEISRGGQIIRKDFVVTQSPPHYNSAKWFKSELLGITVRNITYEVRRYFRLSPDDPGVIVSKLQPGSKASVAGIKPYEIVTHVNDAPVKDVCDFEKFIQTGGDLKLSLKRMNKGRVVILKTTPEPVPADTSPAASTEPNEFH